jgi:ubiquinone/menaquinone biosynthesis C-methylase UbiE
MDPSIQSKSYDQSHTAENYGASYNSRYAHGYYHRQWEDVEKELVTHFAQKYGGHNSVALDFACGTGRVTSIVAPQVDRVTGADISDAMLAAAKKADNITYLNIDLLANDIGEKFDFITSFRFFLNAEESLQRSVLSALHRHLKDDGNLVVNIHMNSKSVVGRMISGLRALTGKFYHNILSEEEFRNLLQDAGFTVVEVKHYSFLPRLGGKIGDAISPMMKTAETIANWLPIPKSLAQSFIVVARKQ